MENSCGCATYLGQPCDTEKCNRTTQKVGTFMNNRPDSPHEAYEPTQCEHFANVASHAIALIPSLWGVWLLVNACHAELQFRASLVYGFAIFSLFLASSTYHSFELFFRPKMRLVRFWLHVLDRAMIYVYMAASYSPWLVIRDSGNVGITMNYITWIFAFCGILYQYIFHERFKRVETVLYVILGAGPAIPVIFAMHDHSGLLTLFYSGLAYGVGIVFFKMDGVIPFAHAIWHCHVLLGALLQFCAVYIYLLDPNITANITKSSFDASLPIVTSFAHTEL